MKLRALTAIAVLALSTAGSAFAGSPLTATLQAPVSAKVRAIAGGAVWNCEGTTCVAAVAPERAASTASCKELAKAVGAIASFGSATFTLEPEALAKCNLSARTTAR